MSGDEMSRVADLDAFDFVVAINVRSYPAPFAFGDSQLVRSERLSILKFLVNLPDQRVFGDDHLEEQAPLLSARQLDVHWEELCNEHRLVLIATDELAAKEDVTHRAILSPLDAGLRTSFGEGPAIRRQRGDIYRCEKSLHYRCDLHSGDR